jgi:hypothetical protein
MQGAPLQQNLMPPLLSSPYPGLFLQSELSLYDNDDANASFDQGQCDLHLKIPHLHMMFSLFNHGCWRLSFKGKIYLHHHLTRIGSCLIKVGGALLHRSLLMLVAGQGMAMQLPTSALCSSKEHIVSQLPYSRLSKSKGLSKGKDSRLAANDKDAGKARPSHSVPMEKAIALAMHQHHLSADDALEYVLAMLARFTTIGSNSSWLLCN